MAAVTSVIVDAASGAPQKRARAKKRQAEADALAAQAEALWKQGIVARLDVHDQRILNLEAATLVLQERANADEAEDLWAEVTRGQLTEQDRDKAFVLIGGASAIAFAAHYKKKKKGGS